MAYCLSFGWKYLFTENAFLSPSLSHSVSLNFFFLPIVIHVCAWLCVANMFASREFTSQSNNTEISQCRNQNTINYNQETRLFTHSFTLALAIFQPYSSLKPGTIQPYSYASDGSDLSKRFRLKCKHVFRRFPRITANHAMMDLISAHTPLNGCSAARHTMLTGWFQWIA